MRGDDLLGLVCGCSGGLAILFVAGLLLKLAVSLANRMVGSAKAQSPTRGRIAEWDWDDWDDDYTSPQRSARRTEAIPIPGIVKCATIVFMTALLSALGLILLGFAAEGVGLRIRREESRIAVVIFDLPLAGLALTVLLVAMLPTTFWRAAMVAFLYGVIFIAIALCAGCTISLVWNLAGG